MVERIGQREQTEGSRGTGLLVSLAPVAFLGGVVLLLFAPYLLHPDWLIWPRSELGSDVILLYWFYRRIFVTAISGGYFPFWDSVTMIGHPVVGEFGFLELYPFTLLYPLFPPTLAFTLMNALHVFLAGVFMYLLIRALFQTTRLAAMIGASAYMLAPQLISHLAGAHLVNVCGMTWVPAILLGARKSIQSRRLWWAALSGVALAMQVMTHPQIPIGTFYLLLGMLGWQCWQVAAHAGWRSFSFLDIVKRSVLVGVVIGGVALVVSAAWWMPVVEVLPWINMVEFDANVPFWYQIPPAMLLSLFTPTEFQFPEWTVYVGTVPLFLALVALLGKRRRDAVFLWSAVVLTLVLSLGDATPVSPVARWLVPGLSYFRTRSRVWVFGGFVVALLAGMGADALRSSVTRARVSRGRRWLNLTGAAYLLCGVIAVVGFWIIREHLPVEIVGAVGAGALALAVFWLWRRRRAAYPVCQAALLAILLLDLFPLAARFMTGIVPRETFLKPDSVTDFLDSQSGDYRIYAMHFEPSYAWSAESGVERIDGVLTFQLAHGVEIVKVASGCHLSGYTVGFPPCLSGEIDPQAYQTTQPEPAVLGLLNVRYVIADFPLNVPDLEPVLVDGKTTVYENHRFLPRAFLVERVEVAPAGVSVVELLPTADVAHTAFVEPGAAFGPLADGPVDGEVIVESRRPGRMALAVQSSREALLLYSESWAPGWRAATDGEPTTVIRVDGALLGVIVPPGASRVVFEYLPLGWRIGWPISLAAIVGLVAWGGASRIRRHKGR